MACKQKAKKQRLLPRGFLFVSFAGKHEVDIKGMIKYVNFHMDFYDSPRSY